jgi:hypothetical protein
MAGVGRPGGFVRDAIGRLTRPLIDRHAVETHRNELGRDLPVLTTARAGLMEKDDERGARGQGSIEISCDGKAVGRRERDGLRGLSSEGTSQQQGRCP